MSSPMIENPEAYFRQFVPQRDALLAELEDEAAREAIPVIGPVVGQLLYILVCITGAQRILELGTATGYSAVWMARACGITGGRVMTVEQSPGLIARAQAVFERAGLSQRIEILQGDARQIMTELSPPVDLIFMDIDKEFYLESLLSCEKLLRPGGLLVADNTGFRDADSFNRAVAVRPGWCSVNLLTWLPFHSPEKDGLCLALRTG